MIVLNVFPSWLQKHFQDLQIQSVEAIEIHS